MIVYLDSADFTFRLISSLEIIKRFVFFCVVYMVPSVVITSSAVTRKWRVQFHFKPSSSFWTFLMAYSKATQQNNSNKTSLDFKPLLVQNMSDKRLPNRTLLQVSFRHIFISITDFIGIPNWMRTLYTTSLLTESQAFLKSIYVWRTAPFSTQFFKIFDD